MKPYVIVDAQGYVTGFGTAPECDISRVVVPPGGQLLKGVSVTVGSMHYRMRFQDGRVVVTTEPLIQQNYGMARRAAYPPIGDQLDALWKYLAPCAADLPPETAAMLDRVLAVKAEHPKP